MLLLLKDAPQKTQPESAILWFVLLQDHKESEGKFCLYSTTKGYLSYKEGQVPFKLVAKVSKIIL